MKRRLCLKLLGASSMLGTSPWALAQTADAEPLPLEFFAQRPTMERVAISPDSKKVAAVVNAGGRSVLVTRDLSGGPIQQVLSTDNLEYLFNWIRWINPERLALSLRFPSERQTGYVRSVATMETRLVAVNWDGSKAINLVKPRGSTAALRWATQQDSVIDWLPKDGQHLLLALPDSEMRIDRAIFKVNVNTGARTHFHASRDDVVSWITDQESRPRVAIARRENGAVAISVRDPAGGNWRPLSEFSAFDEDAISPLGFGLDPYVLYVQAQHQGLSAVHTVDLRDSKLTLKLKLAHERFDLDGGLVHNAKGEAVGVRGATAGDSSSFYWDEEIKALQKEIDESLPGRFNSIAQISADGKNMVIVSEEMGKPAQVFLGETQGSEPFKLLSHTRAELVPHKLGQKKKIQYTARDGLEIEGYLTTPPHAGAGPLPLVLFPHGGPQASDGPDFDNWVAFMADRGYAVLQPNFRGSTGRGQAFMEAGLRKWGLEMQDDLTDAVAEFVKRGVAAPDRVAIVGASYGGYAALMGVVKTPTLYKGAFAFAPVVDLVELTREAGQGSGRNTVRRQVGDAREDRERLEATSPNRHAAKIQVPVVLIHGTHDRQAEYEHSVWMAKALKEAGKPHEFITLDKGDHQLSHHPYRMQTFTKLEEFLATTIGARRPKA